MGMNQKEMVGKKAAEYIEDGMVVGLGTGSTAAYFVAEIGRRVKEEGLTITAVTTSSQTAAQARELGIPLAELDDVDLVDVTVDGADEISTDFQGIKGGGGALLYEKIVAHNSRTVIWIVDESKMVKKLGAFPLPVEVIPKGSRLLLEKFAKMGFNPDFRKQDNGELYRTDEQNYIIDLHLERIEDPHALAQELDSLTGVVEHGLFLDLVSIVLVGTGEEVRVLEVSPYEQGSGGTHNENG